MSVLNNIHSHERAAGRQAGRQARSLNSFFNSKKLSIFGDAVIPLVILSILSLSCETGLTNTTPGSILASIGGGPVADPASVNLTVATTVDSAAAFLYTGSGAVQTGVNADSFVAVRVAIVRGRALVGIGDTGSARADLSRIGDTEAAVVANVKVTVFGHPEFGQTTTNTAGTFSMAVNGGGPLTFQYERSGFPTIQRTENIPWQDYVVFPDVVLTPYDTNVTTITGVTAIQVHRATTSRDSDGTRTATLFFQQSTTCTFTGSSGVTQNLSTYNVRVTEFTVGRNGPNAMPGYLPDGVGYTYCSEFSVDEAVAAGTSRITFSKPVLFYLENFLNFPVGTIVPAGSYELDSAAWVPDSNGRVIRVQSITGGMADLIVDTSGGIANAAALAALGITDAERTQLALTYTVGQELWRTPLTHFSKWDNNCSNRNQGPPENAKQPDVTPKGPSDKKQDNGPTTCHASSIDVGNQILHEDLPVQGTAFGLHYASDQQNGRVDDRMRAVYISGDTVPSSVIRIDYEVTCAGRVIAMGSAPALPRQSITFTWDGKDAFGRTLAGAQIAMVNVGNVYRAVYGTAASFEKNFGYNGNGVPITTNLARQEITLERSVPFPLLIRDAAAAEKLGGWTISDHHSYDPIGRMIYMGDGMRRSSNALGYQLTTVAGNGSGAYNGDGIPATQAGLNPFAFALWNALMQIAPGPDGSIYIADYFNSRVRRVAPNGIISTVAGGGGSAYTNGMVATTATGLGPSNVAVNPQTGELYFNSTHGGANLILKVDRAGLLWTVAGGGTPADDFGDSLPATSAKIVDPAPFFSPDGTLHIKDRDGIYIRKIDRSGIIRTIAGKSGGSAADGILATAARIGFWDAPAFGPDGAIYLTPYMLEHRVRKIGLDGIITTIAGTNGVPGFSGDGGPAIQAKLNTAIGIAVDQAGVIYIADAGNRRIRAITPDGIINTVVGSGVSGFAGDGGPGQLAQLNYPEGMCIAADGALLFFDRNNRRVRKLAPSMSGYTAAEFFIPSEDGAHLYRFNSAGRHLTTINATTGATLLTFGYNSSNLLTTITDAFGNVTTIARGSDGNATTITAPGGQVTTLTMNAKGYLASASNPLSEAHSFTYTDSGLMLTHVNPLSRTSTFSYNALGLITLDLAPAGGSLAYAKVEFDTGYEITQTTALARVSVYKLARAADGSTLSTSCGPAGDQNTSTRYADQSVIGQNADGSRYMVKVAGDPRFGMQVPVVTLRVDTTPSGIVRTVTATHEATVTDSANPLSLVSLRTTSSINGRTYTTTYDVASRTWTSTTPVGRVATMITNTIGQPVSSRADAALDPATFTYDARGRPSVSAQGNQSLTYAYDAAFRVTSVTDAAGNAVTYAYDQADRVTTLTKPGGAQVRFAYDAAGNATSVTSPSGAVSTLGYNARDVQTSQSFPGGVSYGWAYNADRDHTQSTLPGGRTFTLGYSADGRQTSNAYAEATVAYTYLDPTSRIASITRTPVGGGTVQTWTTGYDGSMLRGDTFAGNSNGSFNYRYNNNYHLAGWTIAGTPEFAFTRDNDSLSTVFGTFTITRGGPAGAVSQITDGTLTITYTYDTSARLLTRTNVVSGVTIYSLALTYSNRGLISRKVETIQGTTRTYDYTYDAEARLTQTLRDGGAWEAYAYDVNGNRTSVTEGGGGAQAATFDAQDRITALGATAYTHELDGFMTLRGTDSYTYTAAGELVGARTGGVTASYGFDGMGRMASRTSGGATIQYLFGNRGNPFQLSASIDAGVTSIYFYDEVGLLYAVRRGGVMFYIGSDQVGTPLVLTNAAGGTLLTRALSSFGRRQSESSAYGHLPVGFASGLQDSSTGNVRFGFRDYDAQAGRWMARDPILFASGENNLYTYVANDPINLIDPSGLCPVDKKPPPPKKKPAKFNPKDAWDATKWVYETLKDPMSIIAKPASVIKDAYSDAVGQQFKQRGGIFEPPGTAEIRDFNGMKVPGHRSGDLWGGGETWVADQKAPFSKYGVPLTSDGASAAVGDAAHAAIRHIQWTVGHWGK